MSTPTPLVLDYHPTIQDASDDELELRHAVAAAAAADALGQSLGQNGFTYVNGTAATSGAFVCLYALADTTFTALAGNNLSGNLSGLVLPAGLCLYGQFTSFTLSAGALVAYLR